LLPISCIRPGKSNGYITFIKSALRKRRKKILKNTGDQMNALKLAEKAKKQNIINMAVGEGRL